MAKPVPTRMTIIKSGKLDSQVKRPTLERLYKAGADKTTAVIGGQQARAILDELIRLNRIIAHKEGWDFDNIE